MIVIENINKSDNSLKEACVAIGNFDGIHQGHKSLIEETIVISKKKNLVPTILTFDPMPEEHFNSNGFFRLMDMYDKYKAFESFGIEQVITIPFDKKFSELTKDLFIENILVKKLMTKHLVVGYDFKFGNKRLGDVSLLKLHRDKGIFDLSILDLVTVSGEKVSSRDIRKLINKGNIRDANKLMAAPFSLSGKVIHGEKRGRELGYPTANIEIYNSYPINGIFLVSILFEDKKLYGLASWGNKPTFSGEDHVLEVNIFNFESDIYNKYLKIIFIDKIRDQIKFNDKNELIEQMHEDKKLAENLLGKSNEL